MTIRTLDRLGSGPNVDGLSAKGAGVVFIATQRPVSRLVADALVAQYGKVLCPQSCPQDLARVEHVEAGVLSGIEPVVALVSWADLLYETDECIAARIERSIDSLTRTGCGSGAVTLCFVPFGSFVDGDCHVHEILHRRETLQMSPERPQATFERLTARLSQRRSAARFVITPMLVACDSGASAGYPSFLQKLVRVGVCLSAEVLTKVPAYFSRFDLAFLAAGRARPNVTTPSELASWLSGDAAPLSQLENGPRTIHLDSLLSWHEIAAKLRATSGLRLRFTEDELQCNALDEVFNTVTTSNRDLGSELFRHEVKEDETLTLKSGGALEELSAIASSPIEEGETSYVLVRELEMGDVGGHSRRAQQGHCQAGAIGGCFLLLVPFSVDSGYYAGIARNLERDHKVLIWRPMGNHVEHLTKDSADLRERLRAEQIDDFHVVAWCGGVRLAVRLADDCGGRLRSVCLLAPELSAGEDQSELYKSVVRFFSKIKDHDGNAEEIVARARRSWQDSLRLAASANLEQYSPRARYRKSPLQYHPDRFRSQSAEGLFGDTHQVMDVAQALAVRNDVELAAVRLRQYQGPVVVISGTNDALIKYGGVREQCGRAAGWILVTILGGNHYLVTEHGNTVAALLREFVRTGDLAPAPHDRVTGERIRVERAPLSAGAPPSI